MQVITFSGFVPPPRYDTLSWTEVRIEEAPDESGPWTQIDVIALTPDADPTNPVSRSFTTELASDGNLWYRVIFADASGDTTLPTTPLLNAVGLAGPAAGGPCQAWISADDVQDCCSATLTSTTADWAARLASDLLFELSGHRFNGLCEVTVRPCASYTSCWEGIEHGWRTADCSCQRLPSIRLAGYPVQEILEVIIDDLVIDPYSYRLDRSRELVRLGGDTWPSCQRLELDSGDGTFFVTYSHGVAPPVAATAAAAQLACQIAQECPGANGAIGDCELPAGTVRVTRQGLTIDTQQLGLWLLGSLRTGMPLVDAFLSGYGAPRQRRTALLVPEADPWPLRVE